MMLEITAMFTLKRGLQFKRHILSSAAGMLIAASITPVLAAAHRPELTVLSSAEQDDQTETLAKYQKLLEDNPLSSLANYRIAELLFTQRKYQASANACRLALRGDGHPSWTKVWSHIQLGKIFDMTSQRDRAVMEYQLAIETNDNTRGAIDEARELLNKPYEWPVTPP
jgi:predicted negative regulator of RcsB-dependent stress response